MKLFQFQAEKMVRTGAIYQGQSYDVSDFVSEYNGYFFANVGIAKLENYLKQNSAQLTPLNVHETVFVAPFTTPSKIVCIGLNYADHARETGAEIPQEPVIFLKASTSFCGPFDQIELPRDSVKTDWEVELAVVIGKKAKYISEEDALNYVAGYCVHNDVSEREFQLERGGTWDKGKGCDTFAPMGPYLVTPDEIEDINDLHLWLTVNGQTMQDSSTSNLIFQVPALIAYVSRFMTLLPGDVISTGTPPGVGLGLKPPVFLKEGDVVELGIEGLGISKQKVIKSS